MDIESYKEIKEISEGEFIRSSLIPDISVAEQQLNVKKILDWLPE